MFTGLIQDIGKVESVDAGGDGARLRIATALAREIALGDSVAVNGACLTAVAVDEAGFETEAMNQTLAVTALGGVDARRRRQPRAGDAGLRPARRPHRPGPRRRRRRGDSRSRTTASPAAFASPSPPSLLRYAIDKGSITLSGVSLTIAELGEGWVEVSLIPETLERTNLGELTPGSNLNVECDIVAKYVERLLAPFAGKERA